MVVKSFIISVLIASMLCVSSFAPRANMEAIYEAKYPKSVPMPDQSDYLTEDGNLDYEAYYDDYAIWTGEMLEKSLASGEADGLNAYFSTLSGEILAREDTKNKVLSPVNIYLALSMLAEITSGSTQSEILKFLNAENTNQLRKQANRVFLSIYENDGQTTSIPASSVWLRDDMEYKKKALRILSKDYFASSFSGKMGAPEYDQMIQKWLSDATNGLLSEQAENITFDPDTIIALTTSLYFKAGWNSVFNIASTQRDLFHAVSGDEEAEFMHKGGTDTYYWGEDFGAIALPLTNGGGMWFILPDEGVSPERLFEKGDILALSRDPSDWENQKQLIVHKSIPKFDVTGENDLIGSLKNLGIEAAFDSQKSDFTPLTDIPEIVVSKAEHDARVKIDEQGVEAAAFTVIMAMATSARSPEDKMDFIVDRPFAFVITSRDGLPLFTGVVNHIEK